MKPVMIPLLAACAGFGLGFGLPMLRSDRPQTSESDPPALSLRTRSFSTKDLAADSRMQALAEKAATLSKDEWPDFFRDQLRSPESARLAARLWTEADPAGFWAWLRADFDLLRFTEFAPELVQRWAVTAPDAAMDAVAAITDKRLGGEMRIKVIDAVLEVDVRKGIELAARAGDFNSFSWGPRGWIKRDPEAAVTALGTLPLVSDYRHFLNYALPIWAESDPAAALTWMAGAHSYPATEGDRGDEWLKKGFEAVAKSDPAAALAIARNLAPAKRTQALAGVIASGALDLDSLKFALRDLPPTATRMLAGDLVNARPSETLADLQQTAALLEAIPSERNNLLGVARLARQWKEVDAPSAWQWATSLTDPEMRRRAFQNMADGATPQQVAALPTLALSNEFFRNALAQIPADQREPWIRQLPADLAAWARSVDE